MTTTLLTNLTDHDDDTRFGAAIALATVEPTTEVATALVERLGTETQCNVREALTWACVQQREVTMPLVVAKLDDPAPAVRQQAAHVLSKIGGDGIAEHLDAVLADADPQVAVKAFRAAAATGDVRVVAPLLARLGDGDQEQRDALAVALARVGDPAVPGLIEALSHADAGIRLHAADALGHVGSPAANAATDALALALDDVDPDVRLAAISALGELDRALTATAIRTATSSVDARVAMVAQALAQRPAVED